MSYRHISLFCCIPKLLEKLTFDKTFDYLIANVVTSSQYEFIKSRSTIQQLLTCISFVVNAFDGKTQVDTICLDIKRHLTLSPVVNYLLDCVVLV